MDKNELELSSLFLPELFILIVFENLVHNRASGKTASAHFFTYSTWDGSHENGESIISETYNPFE